MSGKEKKELHWGAKLKSIRPMRILQQTIYCQPEVEESAVPQPKHEFQTSKVYVFLDEEGREQDGIVVCPVHNQPISVMINRQQRPPPTTVL